MRGKRADEWYPFWVDKWLFGSTRHEFTHAQRAIWVDLLTLSKKDSGFIRANKSVPYPVPQLSGLFTASIKLVSSTIKRAIESGKLKKMDDGTLFVVSTDTYTISERHKRRVENAHMSEKPDIMSDDADTKNRIEESACEAHALEEEIDNTRPAPQGEFEREFWPNVPNRIGKGKAREAYLIARQKKKISKEAILAGLPKYRAYEESRRKAAPDNYRPLHPATWLNQERWDDELIEEKSNVQREFERLKAAGEI